MTDRNDQPDKRSGRWRLFNDSSKQVDRFGSLLLVIIATVVVLSLVDLDTLDIGGELSGTAIVVTLFVGATFLLAMRASGVSRRYRLIADIAVVAALLGTIIFVIADIPVAVGDGTTVGPPIPWIVLSVLAPVIVVRRLIHHRRASAKTLAGAVSAFLLLAIAFSFLFLAVDAGSSTPFFGTEEPSTSFMYFSIVTITTLGYGDLSAVEPLGRLLTTAEAIIGQVYLVTFVGMIVGLLVAQRTSPDHNAQEEDPPFEP